MRRDPPLRDPPHRMLRYLGVALLLTLTWATTMSVCVVSARAAAFPTLVPDPNPDPAKEHKAEIAPFDFGVAGRTWGYWGTLVRLNDGVKWGSYRATCVWLAKSGVAEDKRDNRMVCTIVLTAVHGGTLIAQGQLIRPRGDDYLFARASSCTSAQRPAPAQCRPRSLAITGATYPYESRLGYAVDLTTPGRITITQHV
jgi:hypothetical protein